MSVNSKMTALADEIRELSGTTEAIGIDSMTEQVSEANNEVESQTELLAQAVSALSEKAGVNSEAVFEAGRKAEYDRFWDTYQNNGNRNSYSYAFAGGSWNDDLYAPKYQIIGSSLNALNNLFLYSSVTDTKVDIVYNNDCRLSSTFSAATKMVIVRKLVVNENTTYTESAFGATTKLEELNFEGVIGQSGLNVAACTKLTHDSLMSIINCLQTKTSGTWTVTLGTTNLAKLTDAEKAIATQKGWTLA